MAKYWPLHQRCVITGTAVGGEVWAMGFNTIWGALPGVQIAYEDQQSVCDSIKASFMTWWNYSTGTAPRFTTLTSVAMVKFNSIGHDGKYVFPLSTETEITPPVAGPVATGGNLRASLVVSLRTSSATRGRGAFGRFYPPTMSNLASENGTTPYLAEADANGVATRASTFLKAVNAIEVSGSPITVVNVSPGNDVIGTPALTYPVTSILVDRLIDTQRRRTNRIPSVGVTQTL